MSQQFEPIAIVGNGCVLPGCDSAQALWDAVAAGRSHLSPAPEGDWRVDMAKVLSGEPGRYVPNKTWSDVGGYVRGFADTFDPAATTLDPSLVASLDPLFQWSLHAAGQALQGLQAPKGGRAGVILGNLSYPTRSHNHLAEQEWCRRLLGDRLPAREDIHAWNRFMSGLPAMLVARAFGFEAGSLALDAACASGLYAIKLACDRLQDGRADFMLAGAVNAADQLFLHVGFSALNALSRTGQSRPFHQDADGLVPAEGAAFVALKRLSDAQAAGDRILGVIRGVGLSNDGRSGGFLAPSQAGQERSMRDALAQAGLAPGEVQYIECHATGTPVGDATEIASLAAVYGKDEALPLGSLKANLGHLITASGVAGLIKVLAAMAHGQIPATPGSRPLTGALKDTGFQVPAENLPWDPSNGQRTAAVSSFGFGGNNAHLIVQQYAPPATPQAVRTMDAAMEFAVVGLGLRTHLDRDVASCAARLLGGEAVAADADADSIVLTAKQLAFPPADLKQALGQQLILLDVVQQATRELPPLDAERTGIYVGMQTDSEICRYGLRWRWPGLLRQAGLQPDAGSLARMEDAVSLSLDAAGVIGKMPNIVANRLSNQLDIRGPGFVVSREELSGDAALDLACTAIRRGEVDTALVAAVDLCREAVHEHAARAALGPAVENAADAAVMLVIKSRAQAERDGDTILGLIAKDDAAATAALCNRPESSPLQAHLGHAHAASGLLHIALGLLMLRTRRRIDADGEVMPLLPQGGARQVAVRNHSFAGEQAQWLLAESPAAAPSLLQPNQPPAVRTYAAGDLASLLARIRNDEDGGEGPCRLAIVADAGQIGAQRARALQALESEQLGEAWSLEGISFRQRPLAGELAFAFTGAAAAYPDMGRDLLLGMPQLTAGLAGRLRNMDVAVGWAYRDNEAESRSPFSQLAGSSFLCQLHMQLSRQVLGLRPTASIGLSSGETNAMFAFGAWQDFDGLLDDIEQSGLYSAALANTFDAVRAHWQLPAGTPVEWDNFRLRAPVDAVRAALQGLERVYLTIVNSPSDCVIGGDRRACEALLAALGNPPAVPLGHDLAIHCEAVAPFEATWRGLHTRPTSRVEGVRFYSNYFGGVFEPDRESVADALTGQALQTIDFPPIVERAWADGVRIFVEHGPRNGLAAAIGEILGTREHLAVSLDRPGVSSLVQAYRAAAQLWCAGVDVDLDGLRSASQQVLPATAAPAAGTATVSFRLRPPPVAMPSLPTPTPTLAPMPAASAGGSAGKSVYVPPAVSAGAPGGRLLPSAPALAWLVTPAAAAVQAPVLQAAAVQKPVAAAVAAPVAPASSSSSASASRVPAAAPQPSPAAPAAIPPATLSSAPPATPVAPPAGMPLPVALLLAGHRQLVEAHNAYLQAQGQAQQAFAATMSRLQSTLLGQVPSAQVSLVSAPAAAAVPIPPTPAATVAATVTVAVPSVLPEAAAIGETAPAPIPAAVENTAASAMPDAERAPVRTLAGPAFSREQLEVLAGGKISSVFGKAFEGQDQYDVQVRMPKPPLLLCDRVLGIEGEPHSMGQGTIWTETDVRADSWYLHNGRMPAGIFIESGQADLLLISWLGIDALNKGERAYRLLGCDLVFHGDLPAPGDTLEYTIKVDGHARQGDVRLFFFHYDCYIKGELRISVRNGQAGFFTREELAGSAGVIWSPETARYIADPRLAAPPARCGKSRFSVAEVEAYLQGDLVTCFGEDFYWANTHTRTPRTPAGRHNFLGEVVQFDMAGGPAGRGYLRVEKPVAPDEWFFDGHFKNDPCMPGTLMAEACLQAMAFYMAAAGFTLRCDGWRFKPVSDQPYRFKCRGQVTPESKQIVYELFVDELVDGPMPILYAHVLCSVDGRKAFLCERLGLQLVPDWPLTSMPDYIVDKQDSRPLARLGDFALDYRSLINCAWGKPSLAFGEGFAHYNGPRRSPRLPGPPYHFMTRITGLQGEMAHMKAGARVTAVYDLEPDAWFFAENASPTMPNCALMEVALQPCGWLASFTLARPASERELLFRNLDGESVQSREITPADRSITTEVELVSVSQVGDLIIEKFRVLCTIAGETVLQVETVFGFFPPAAMINQKGFGATPEDVARLELASDTRIELDQRPARLFGGRGAARLPVSKLLMIDRISGYWPQGGAAGLGAIRAEKDVDSRDWFFKAHFYQDPVQPGSLGVEAMLQAIQSLMLLAEMDANIDNPRFEPIDIGGQAVWHYRGQVTPDKGRIAVEFEASEISRDDQGVCVIGMARLWVDGLQIYQAPRIGMRIVAGPARALADVPDAVPDAAQAAAVTEWQLDLDRPQDAWIGDHCPTYTLPALPLTYELEMMAVAAGARFPGSTLVAIEKAHARQWIAFPEKTASGRAAVKPGGPGLAEVSLECESGDGRLVTAATAQLRFDAAWPVARLAPLEPLRNPQRIEAPYETCGLFHGPALQLMRDLQRGDNGAQAILDGSGKGVPAGLLNPGLLDAALHCIPHDDFRFWCAQVPEGMAAYPVRIENMQLFGALNAPGDVEVQARFVALEAATLPRTHLRLSRGGQLLAIFDLVEVLLPKGRLGAISAAARQAFLGQRRYLPGVALAQVGETETRLPRQDVARSDWLPGTLARVYGVNEASADLPREIAMREHVGAQVRLHPGAVRMAADGSACLNLPLNRYAVEAVEQDGAVVIRSAAPAALDWEILHRDWSTRMAGEAGFVRDLGIALIRRFVRRVVLADPEGFAALRGRPVLYLGNHQTGIESFLFLAVATSLAQLPAGAIAKQEHRQSWIGKIHQMAELAMGARNPLRMLFFDRANQADMLRLLKEFGASLAQDPCSLLVHVDGTRSLQAGAPVRAVSSVLIDLALAHDMPIVPVRFAGGLPLEAGDERLEFPQALGQQDYFLGQALSPAMLKALPYARRAQIVTEHINRLGPAGAADVPLPGDAAFTAAVAQGRAAGRSDIQAVLHAALQEFPGCDAQTLQMLLPQAGTDDPAVRLMREALGTSSQQG